MSDCPSDVTAIFDRMPSVLLMKPVSVLSKSLAMSVPGMPATTFLVEAPQLMATPVLDIALYRLQNHRLVLGHLPIVLRTQQLVPRIAIRAKGKCVASPVSTTCTYEQFAYG